MGGHLLIVKCLKEAKANLHLQSVVSYVHLALTSSMDGQLLC